jgi:murein DD-endopeptidase MepM/ murein hydrolase activator NlpD
MTALLVIALAAVVPVLPVRFEPATPALGDTISVFVDLDEASPPPAISVGDRTFPSFDLGQGRYRAFVPVSPLDKPGRWRIKIEDGKRTATAVVPVAPRKFGVQRIWLRGVPVGLDDIERARVGEVKTLATAARCWQGAFQKPAGGRVSSPYGVRRYRNGIFLTDYYHRGIDYAPGAGAKVLAPADGKVVLVGLEREGFRIHGNTVGIDHGHGVVSLMLHLSRAAVREGDDVRAGDPIGLVGASGAVTGPHLHWALYVNGVAVDPMPWLSTAIE